MKTVHELFMESNAIEARELEYLKEAKDSDIFDSYVEKSDLEKTPDMADIVDEFKDAKEIIDKMPEGDEYKSEEVSRILDINESITFDEMIGITEDGE